jgi:hypothetical protein
MKIIKKVVEIIKKVVEAFFRMVIVFVPLLFGYFLIGTTVLIAFMFIVEIYFIIDDGAAGKPILITYEDIRFPLIFICSVSVYSFYKEAGNLADCFFGLFEEWHLKIYGYEFLRKNKDK